jgi:hypothetical protein
VGISDSVLAMETAACRIDHDASWLDAGGDVAM